MGRAAAKVKAAAVAVQETATPKKTENAPATKKKVQKAVLKDPVQHKKVNTKVHKTAAKVHKAHKSTLAKIDAGVSDTSAMTSKIEKRAQTLSQQIMKKLPTRA